jgi:hypothetical protein
VGAARDDGRGAAHGHGLRPGDALVGFRNMGLTYLYKVLPDGSERATTTTSSRTSTRATTCARLRVHRFKDPYAAFS